MAKSTILAPDPELESPFAQTLAKAAPVAPAPVATLPALPEGKIRGWRVVHPGYGSLRVWALDGVTNEEQAVEKYRTDNCPFLKLESLRDSGLQVHPLVFTPADTEIGKPPNEPQR